MLVRKKPSVEVKKVVKPNDRMGIFNSFFNALSQTSFNMDIFFYNIPSIELKKVSSFKKDEKKFLAGYDIEVNKIRYLSEQFRNSIMHELFHMSSSIIKDNYIYSGFFQKNLDTGECIGLGFTEIYTMLLDKKYFLDFVDGKEDVLKTENKLSVYFVTLIQDVIGEDEMEKMYSECDLYTLMHRLTFLSDKKSTFKFLRALDYIFLSFEGKRFVFITPKLRRLIDFCNCYTCKVLLNFCKQCYNSGEMSNECYNDIVESIATQFSKPIVIGKYFKTRTKIISRDAVYKYARISK